MCVPPQAANAKSALKILSQIGGEGVREQLQGKEVRDALRNYGGYNHQVRARVKGDLI